MDNPIRPLVSFLIPVYNPNESYIFEAIYSLLKQTYANFEIIIVNDGSTNGFNFQRLLVDERIFLYHFESNLGISNAINYAVKNSKGYYLARMDADDISFSNRLELQTKLLIENDIVSSNVIVIDQAGNRIGKSKTIPFHNAIRRFQLYFTFKNPVNHPTIIAKREVFEKFEYNSEYDGAEDFELWLRMAKQYKIFFDKSYVLFYRDNLNESVKRKLIHKSIKAKYLKRVRCNL
jgi:glycosyltransferase involved in cell wall biosynthesis